MEYTFGGISNLLSSNKADNSNKYKIVTTEIELKPKSDKKPKYNLINQKKEKKSQNGIKKIGKIKHEKIKKSNVKQISKTHSESENRDQNEKTFTDTNGFEITARTIFVGNWPIKKNTKALKRYFLKYGEIESVRLRSVPLSDTRVSKKVTAITKQFHPERTSTNAYVKFSNEESAKKAIVENGAIVDEHHLRVTEALTSNINDTKRSIFIGNLPFQAEEDDLWKTFENCGEIDSVRIIRDSKTAMSKGIAYVNFKQLDGVELALKIDGVQIKGRNLRIKRANNKEKRKSNIKVKTQKSISNSEAYLRRKGKKNNFQGLKVTPKIKNKSKKKFKPLKRLNKNKNVNY